MTARGVTVALTLGALLGAAPCLAQDPQVRASLADEHTVWVGQRVNLTVELLVPGYFASAASFDVPDPDGVLLMPPLGHPVLGNENIDGTLYTVQRHQLAVWPMRPGEQAIPAFTIHVSFKRNPLDRDAVAASLTSEPLPFTVALPPGAERLGTVISARDLTIEENWEPEPGPEPVQAGAAFTRTVTLSAPDVPGMIFPPFTVPAIEGVRVYSRPQVLDRTDRGSLTGVRRDVVTYVVQRAGEFVVPAVRLRWFDLDAQELRTEQLPARRLIVVANPAMAPAAGGTGAAVPGDGRGLLAVGGAVLLVLLVRVLSRNRRVRAWVGRGAAQFRPLRLQPLNPPARPSRPPAARGRP